MKFVQKPTAALMTAFMFWFGFVGFAPSVRAENPVDGAQFITLNAIDRAADEVTHVAGRPGRCGPYVNLMADPVNPDFQPDPRLYKIFAPTEEPCGDVETRHGWLTNRRLRKDQALAIPLSGVGDPIIVACGNRFRPSGDLVGKYFECPTQTCPPPEVRTIEVPGPERITYRDREPLQIQPQRNSRPWCLHGIGPVVCFVLPLGILAAALSHHGKKECSTCCPTCPDRTKPKP